MDIKYQPGKIDMTTCPDDIGLEQGSKFRCGLINQPVDLEQLGGANSLLVWEVEIINFFAITLGKIRQPNRLFFGIRKQQVPILR